VFFFFFFFFLFIDKSGLMLVRSIPSEIKN
jgi:hypothetical protein